MTAWSFQLLYPLSQFKQVCPSSRRSLRSLTSPLAELLRTPGRGGSTAPRSHFNLNSWWSVGHKPFKCSAELLVQIYLSLCQEVPKRRVLNFLDSVMWGFVNSRTRDLIYKKVVCFCRYVPTHLTIRAILMSRRKLDVTNSDPVSKAKWVNANYNCSIGILAIR